MERERRLFACPLKLPCMNTRMTGSVTESIKSSLLELYTTFVNNSIDTVSFCYWDRFSGTKLLSIVINNYTKH